MGLQVSPINSKVFLMAKFALFVVLILCLVDLVGGWGAGWFVACVMSVLVCLIFLLVSLVVYAL